MARSRLLAAGLVVALGAFFVLWHLPLLSAEGRIRGFNSDAAILGLMGKKMLDGRGFDVFFWGQNYIGPFTSMLVAAWGAVVGEAGPLALRLATFTVVFAGILLTWWAVARIDRRAGLVTAVALAITPPVVLRMMITPLGAEMAFLFGAALLAMLVQHVTSRRGWLSSARGQVAFGVLAGISWWMNQQVVFVLIAGAIVLAWRLGIGTLIDLRPLPRWSLALIVLGALLYLTFVITNLAGIYTPFLFGRATDALLVVGLGLLPLLFRIRWRSLPLTPLARFAAGAAIGYAPVWLGRLLGWYESSYVFGFQPSYPSDIVTKLREMPEVFAHWTGVAEGAVGIAFALVLAFLVIVGFVHARDASRALLALVVLGNVAFYLLAMGPKPHYLISSIGALYALAALGALELWPRGRGAVVAFAILVALSIGIRTHVMHREVLAESDPRPLLARVRAAGCAVCYADFWMAYRYRFLDGEQRAWIPHLSQNRTFAESQRMQRLPGQRCLIRKDETVELLEHDLPLKHDPPRRR